MNLLDRAKICNMHTYINKDTCKYTQIMIARIRIHIHTYTEMRPSIFAGRQCFGRSSHGDTHVCEVGHLCI